MLCAKRRRHEEDIIGDSSTWAKPSKHIPLVMITEKRFLSHGRVDESSSWSGSKGWQRIIMARSIESITTTYKPFLKPIIYTTGGPLALNVMQQKQIERVEYESGFKIDN